MKRVKLYKCLLQVNAVFSCSKCAVILNVRQIIPQLNSLLDCHLGNRSDSRQLSQLAASKI